MRWRRQDDRAPDKRVTQETSIRRVVYAYVTRDDTRQYLH